ncbi:MAG: DUF4861 domain-containing protein [Bacteroidales bacterium]|nr:DUF4861 domain-containing protein [Bacteroidales bacterium]
MKKFTLLLVIGVLLAGCNEDRMKIRIVNNLSSDRTTEIVEVPFSEIMNEFPQAAPGNLVVMNSEGDLVPSQVIYEGGDQPLYLIFQPSVSANSEAVYYISEGITAAYEPKAYGRFVPERMDDYAWENDRIAFRIYGTALIEKDGPSNGIDAWVKRTGKMVIDRWYAGYLSGKNTYHDDNGEGCDCYKVGRTLGAGAMAPWINDSLWLGINFESYETLDNGPLRTSFRLKYPPFMAGDVMVNETRTLSLDAGSQLTMITEEYQGSDKPFTVASGIVKREEGSPVMLPDETAGIAYRLDGGEGGITYVGALLTSPVVKVTENIDHLLIATEYTPGVLLTYYAGAGWSKWGFNTDQSWADYLNEFALRIRNPLQVITD